MLLIFLELSTNVFSGLIVIKPLTGEKDYIWFFIFFISTSSTTF